MVSRIFTLGVGLMWLTSAATAPPAQTDTRAFALDGPLPAVAAQFRQETVENGRVVASEDWRLWRDSDRIVSERPTAQTGEIWQRDGHALIITRLFHGYRRGIEYQPGDIAMIGAASDWNRKALAVDPAALRQLEVSNSTNADGLPTLRYSGMLDGAKWDVTLRRDLMVPTRVVVHHGDRLERVTLVDAQPLASAPWQPTPSRDYELIDFADLGDRERDPFVLAIQAAEGGGHGHSHR